MPREPSRNLRQEAERRVEQRFAQQSEALFASHKEQRERDLGAAAVAIGIDVRQERDGASRCEFGRVALDRRGAMRGDGKQVGKRRGHVRRKKKRRPMFRTPLES